MTDLNFEAIITINYLVSFTKKTNTFDSGFSFNSNLREQLQMQQIMRFPVVTRSRKHGICIIILHLHGDTSGSPGLSNHNNIIILFLRCYKKHIYI